MRRSTAVFILVGLCLLGFAVATRDPNSGGEPTRTVSANPTSIAAGGSVTVTWNNGPGNVSGPTTLDTIGIYAPGAANTSVVNWMYDSSCAKIAGGTAKASGSCSFTMPTTTGTQKFEFRLLGSDGLTTIATSGNITVTANARNVIASGPTVTTDVSSVPRGGPVTVSWSNVSRPVTRDWLGLYTSRAPNTDRLSWKFYSSCTQTAAATAKASGSCSFTMPTTTGTYQFRLINNEGFVDIATSPNLTVS
jgi:hypothetical protein